MALRRAACKTWQSVVGAVAKELQLHPNKLDGAFNKCYCADCRPVPAELKGRTKLTGPPGEQKRSTIPFGW